MESDENIIVIVYFKSWESSDRILKRQLEI